MFGPSQKVDVDGQGFIVAAVNRQGHLLLRPAGVKEDLSSTLRRVAARVEAESAPRRALRLKALDLLEQECVKLRTALDLTVKVKTGIHSIELAPLLAALMESQKWK